MSRGVRVQVPLLAPKSFLQELRNHPVETIFILCYNIKMVFRLQRNKWEFEAQTIFDILV